MNYEAARAALDRLPRFEVKPGLERIERLLRAVGLPERTFPTIHVAGTNGKGSVVAMLDSVLRAAGLGVGRFTSPQLVDFRDRITIDGRWLSKHELTAAFSRLWPAVATADDAPAQFEVVAALALDAFSRTGVDIAVVEVGLGGRFDATNVVRPTLTILTNVDLDHTAILGETIEQIAWEKAGIAKPGVPLLVGTLSDEAHHVVERECASVGAELLSDSDVDLVREPDRGSLAVYRVDGDELPSLVELGLLGGYQEENLRVALRAILALRLTGLTLPEEAILEGLRTVSWPGRMEIVRRSPTVFLEGAHNVSAAAALARDVERLAPDRGRRNLLFGAFADKDVAGMLDVLVPAFDRIAVAPPASPRALPVEDLARLLDERGARHACYDSIELALRTELASAGEGDVWFVAGSLTVVAEAREVLEGGG